MRLALAYGRADLSLREASVWAEAAGVARVSDVALLNRLRHAAAWLGKVVRALLAARLLAPDAAGAGGHHLLLPDAIRLCEPGADRTSFRVHLGWDLLASGAALYRFRWQVELAFKHWKGRAWPASTPCWPRTSASRGPGSMPG